MTDDLTALRATVSKLLIPILWLHLPLVIWLAWWLGNDWPAAALVSFIVAVVATTAWYVAPAARSARLTIGVAYIAMVSVTLAVSRNSGFQLDIHMYYFAALAILAAYCDWEVVLAGATATAIHHIVLNFAAPALLFPAGADFARVILHAVIVVFEAVVLIWMTHRVSGLFEQSAKSLADAAAASEVKATLEREAQGQRHLVEAERKAGLARLTESADQQSHVVEAVSVALERVAGGDLSYRLTEKVPSEFQKLQDDFNEAMQSLRVALTAVIGSSGVIQVSASEISKASDD
ncbi:MAG TPA: methyl-accepting chemotaxis protein, partial [Acidisoma sp.]|nr:methyl-accepting chemotaxis protein [Acidisoma sp.]